MTVYRRKVEAQIVLKQSEKRQNYSLREDVYFAGVFGYTEGVFVERCPLSVVRKTKNGQRKTVFKLNTQP